MLIDESQLCSWSTALWDTMMDCQVWYAQLSVKHLVTRRPSRSVNVYSYISGHAGINGTQVFDLSAPKVPQIRSQSEPYENRTSFIGGYFMYFPYKYTKDLGHILYLSANIFLLGRFCIGFFGSWDNGVKKTGIRAEPWLPELSSAVLESYVENEFSFLTLILSVLYPTLKSTVALFLIDISVLALE